MWKVTGSCVIDNLFHSLREERPKLELLLRVFLLLKKLLAGEEKNSELFDILKSAVEFLKIEKFSAEELKSAECILILRILRNLGYMRTSEKFEIFAKDEAWSRELLKEMNPLAIKAVYEINHALAESHLIN